MSNAQPTPRDQLLWGIFVTALEGGINYWASVESYHVYESRTSLVEDVEGFYADILDHEDDTEPTHYRIDRKVIARGYKLATGEHRDHVYWSSGEKPPLVVTEDTDWDFDASDADAIVQLGIWSALVYG